MNHIYYDPSNDSVYRGKDGWYCVVDEREFGPWANKGAASAGMAAEQRRAENRRLRHAEEAA